jgi:hypothetical protein
MVHLLAAQELKKSETTISEAKDRSSTTQPMSPPKIGTQYQHTSANRVRLGSHERRSPQDATFLEPLVISSDSEDQEMYDTSQGRSLPSPSHACNNLKVRQYSSSPTTSVSVKMAKQAVRTEEKIDLRTCSGARTAFPLITSNPILEPPTKTPSLSRPRELNQSRLAKTASLSSDKVALQLAGHDLNTARPYLNSQARTDLAEGLARACSSKGGSMTLSISERESLVGAIIHVDFSIEEVEYINSKIISVFNIEPPRSTNERVCAQDLMSGRDNQIPKILMACQSCKKSTDMDIGEKLVASRTEFALRSFLQDAAAGRLLSQPAVVRIEPSPLLPLPKAKRTSAISKILLQRSIYGSSRVQGGASFSGMLTHIMEDSLSRRAEWTDCSGDVATITWAPDGGFICGATAHLDSHNMQYNKPGNLVVGSVSRNVLTSVAGHRRRRPLVQKGDNALPSMRQTQDPWIYCSVTSIAYSHELNKCFTGGFDCTVKIWNLANNGSSMDLKGTWEHDGHVNFVITSLNHSLVATASDVGQNAIRVYELNKDDISNSSYVTYSGEKAQELAMARRQDSEVKWAYHPATMAWGKSPTVAHLLLVGYSPRSYDCEEADIPDEKANTGELCLWNIENGQRVSITTARTQNVFEVVWHPTLPIFVAATSPLGEFEDDTRTQLRLFCQSSTGSFTHMKTLDCVALDINEITIMYVLDLLL